MYFKKWFNNMTYTYMLKINWGMLHKVIRVEGLNRY